MDGTVDKELATPVTTGDVKGLAKGTMIGGLPPE